MIIKVATGSRKLQEVYVDREDPPVLGARILYYTSSKSINTGIVWGYDLEQINTSKSYGTLISLDRTPIVNKAFIEAIKEAGEYYIYPPWALIVKTIPSIMFKYITGFLEPAIKESEAYADKTLKLVFRLLKKRSLTIEEAYKKYKKEHIDFYLQKGLLRLTDNPEFLVKLDINQKSTEELLLKRANISFIVGDYKKFLYSFKEDGQNLIITPSIHVAKDLSEDLKAILLKTPVNILNAIQCYKKVFTEDGVFVSTLSGVSLPFFNLKHIFIVDDMYSDIYKSKKEPFVDYRRLAYYIAKYTGAKIYYASNTLSVNGYFLQQEKRANVINIELNMPKIEIITKKNKKVLIEDSVLDIIKQNLNKKILFYVNKSGYSYAYCPRCDASDTCVYCESYITYFKSMNMLKCTRCGKVKQDFICSRCGYDLMISGAGIEQYKEYIEAIFGKRENFNFESHTPEEEFDIVFGFLLENLLFAPELSAREIYHNKLWQLASKAKEVFVLETLHIDKQSIESLLNRNQNIFLEDELKRRQDSKEPPFTKAILIEMKDNIELLYNELTEEGFLYVSKPKYFYEKGERHFRLLVKIKNQANLRRLSTILRRYKHYKINVGIESFV